MDTTKKKKSSVSHKVLGILGIIFCVILIPILIINVTLIIKSYTRQDEVPQIGGLCPLIVLTGSMEPVISSGDLIITRQTAPDDVREGDIISFFDPDGSGTSVLTHRVTKVIQENGSLSFRTKGDANNTEDRLAVTSDKLIGVYQTKLSGMGHVAMFMQTPAGLIICVVVPLVLLVGWDILRRRNADKRSRKDTDALLAELNALKAQQAAQNAAVNVQEEKRPVTAGAQPPESPSDEEKGNTE